MTGLDWIVLVGTIAFIVIYGAWKTRGARDMSTYFRDDTLRWPTIGLSIMATQASAITFLSLPGQAYEDGLRFVQFYFGLPLAMIVISAVFVPIYYRLKVYTAYEYLEHRFDVRVRSLGALLFLVQRGLAAGITIYAPAIILSTILGWPLNLTTLTIGLAVIVYTVSGGTRAVSQTQRQQMIVMLAGLAVAAVLIVWRLPEGVSLPAALKLAGALDRMNAVSFELDFNNRYNFWSGIGGGFFLALAYFGTDQSQVQRYLSGRSVAESRLGLLFNGLLKIPMQFVILLLGVLMFVFYLFTPPPIFFNTPALAAAERSEHGPALRALQQRYEGALTARRAAAAAYVAALDAPAAAQGAARAALRATAADAEALRGEAKALVARAVPRAETTDADYVFIGFVLRYVPSGLVGLLVAVILCAAMSSTSSELAALGSTTTLDLYKRLWHPHATPRHDLLMSKLFTVLWGLVAVAFATFAALLDNLIQAVNILGSVFYGTVLGLFVVAFFVRRVGATPVLIAACIAQATVLVLFLASDLGFLWFNVIGCSLVVGLSLVFELLGGAPRVRAGVGNAAAALVLLLPALPAAAIPATPVMTLYQFDGPLEVPYYDVARVGPDGPGRAAGTLAQGTPVVPCLVLRDSVPVTDGRGTPYVGFEIVVDARRATPESAAHFTAVAARRRALEVDDHHCPPGTAHVLDVRRLYALGTAPRFDPRRAAAPPAAAPAQGELDAIVRAFHASPQCETANRGLIGRRATLARAWDAFAAARAGDWPARSLTRARQLDVVLRTAIYEGHLERGCGAYGACERNVIALSIRNRGVERCLRGQGCRTAGDFEGVAATVSQYNIWDETLTQTSGLTACFLRPDLAGHERYGRLQAKYAQSVGDVEDILFGDAGALRAVFPGTPLAELTRLRH